ncbi:SDR family oxidoreductase [Rhizosaccharibacter radicis]|uniref:SDR family oxidoreductase n=1 Tax=Rhizosaccharibacter radicis TaxID=2782605 RepID=A0ABT1W1H4_9PROT|nr:SDR family oxidoreductase [Acetobacteraceae bacterium KSS12]
MSQHSRRTAIVTGASGGIGAAISQRLAADGFAVAVHYSSSRDAADRLVAAIAANGGHAAAIPADLAAHDGARILFDQTEQRLGPVDVLVNNAGLNDLAPVAESTDEMFDRQVAVNLGGAFRGMREAAARLRPQGRIINISTSVVGVFLPTYGVYAATKAAVEALTRVMSKEMGERGITVNAVAPGPVETPLFLRNKSEERVQAIANMNPFRRLGQPDDIAGVVAFLAGPDAGWVNGQVIRANGGMV